MKKKPELNHTLLTPEGKCAACQFLRTALVMMAEEYRAEFQAMLDAATAQHQAEKIKQPEFWLPVTTEADPWAR